MMITEKRLRQLIREMATGIVEPEEFFAKVKEIAVLDARMSPEAVVEDILHYFAEEGRGIPEAQADEAETYVQHLRGGVPANELKPGDVFKLKSGEVATVPSVGWSAVGPAKNLYYVQDGVRRRLTFFGVADAGLPKFELVSRGGPPAAWTEDSLQPPRRGRK